MLAVFSAPGRSSRPQILPRGLSLRLSFIPTASGNRLFSLPTFFHSLTYFVLTLQAESNRCYFSSQSLFVHEIFYFPPCSLLRLSLFVKAQPHLHASTGQTQERAPSLAISYQLPRHNAQVTRDAFTMKASIILPLLALAARVLAAVPPACLLSAVNTQDNPSDLSSVCGSDALDAQEAIASICSGNAMSAAQSAFLSTCSGAGSSVGTFLS